MNLKLCKYYSILMVLLNSLSASAMNSPSHNLDGLPFDCLKTIVSSLRAKDIAIVSCVNKELCKVAESVVSGHSDSVELNDGSWIFIEQALEQGRLADLKPIENLHTRLHSSHELRNRFVKKMTSDSSAILNDASLSMEEKQEKRVELHAHYMHLGLLSDVFESKSPVENLASILVGLEFWAQIWEEIREQLKNKIATPVWIQVEDQVKAQVESQCGDQDWAHVWVQIWDQIGDHLGGRIGDYIGEGIGDYLGDQIWEQIWNHVGDRVGGEIAGDLGRNFKFCEAHFSRRLEDELHPATNHLLNAIQLPALIAMHTPEFERIHEEYVAYLTESVETVKINNILNELEIPKSENTHIDAFLQLIQNNIKNQ